MTDMTAFQTAVAEVWSAKVPQGQRSTDAPAAVAKLTEEAGEVARVVIRAEGWGIDTTMTTEDAQEALRLEIGDVLFTLARLANLYEVNLAEAGREAVARFERRRYRG